MFAAYRGGALEHAAKAADSRQIIDTGKRLCHPSGAWPGGEQA
ncbi:MAG TPA: hypothetical protein VI111_02505 [Thermoleophilaceae bacterium]